MNEQNLNPDALEAAAFVLCDETAGQHTRYADLKTGLAKKLWGQRAEHVVSAYLAAAQPEVNSVEELDQLPNFSYVQGYDGFKHVKTGSGNAWGMITMSSGSSLHDSTSIELPATVLYRPVEG